MKEKWQKIRGYEGYYEISDRGRVKSVDRYIIRRGNRARVYSRILKPGLQGRQNKQYLFVILCKNGNQHSIAIHRLVGRHFVPNPKKLTHLNHKNHNSLDNRAKNLHWVNNRINVLHGKNSRHPGSIKQRNGRYTAQINFKNKTYYLGSFKTARQASNSYKKALKKFTGISL